MGKKKHPQFKKTRVLLNEIQAGPIRHPEGLTPFQVEWMRALYKRVGHYMYPAFEQWELGFMRDTHPEMEIMIWEAIARVYEFYVGKHPDCDPKDSMLRIAAISSGNCPGEKWTKKYKEMKRIFADVWKEMCDNPTAVIAEVAKPLGYSVTEDGTIVKDDDAEET